MTATAGPQDGPGWRIRPVRADDGPHLAEVFRRSVAGLGPAFFRPEQVEAWLAAAPAVAVLADPSPEGARTVVVAADRAGRPVAYAELQAGGHIGQVYCSPEVAGRGVASALYDQLEATAREQGVAVLRVEASEAARPLFAHKGFTLVGRRDLVRRGVELHNFAMTKRLADGPAGPAGPADWSEGPEPAAAVWVDPRLAVRPSPIEGRGLVATEPVAAGTVVIRLGGRLVGTAELGERIAAVRADPTLAYVDTISVTDDLHLLMPPATPAHFANHSCAPALAPLRRYELATTRPLAPGDEATVDYGPLSGAGGLDLDCRCGAPGCRGRITGRTG